MARFSALALSFLWAATASAFLPRLRVSNHNVESFGACLTSTTKLYYINSRKNTPQNRDFYAILGVSRNADAAEIKRAYRKLAKQYHPDANPNQDTTEKFQEVNRAYEVLINPELKKKYGMYGEQGIGTSAASDAAGSSSPFGGGSYGQKVDLGDTFDSFSGGGMGGGVHARDRDRARGPVVGNDLRFDLEIDFKTAVFGGEKNVCIRHLETCDTCSGNGVKLGSKVSTCSTCGGYGVTVQVTRASTLGGNFHQSQQTCPTCRGTGQLIEEHCGTCGGQSLKNKTKRIKVTIPPGVKDGDKLRVRGEGDAGPNGGPAGDLCIFLKVKEETRESLVKEIARLERDLKVQKEATAEQASKARANWDKRMEVGAELSKLQKKTKAAISEREKERQQQEEALRAKDEASAEQQAERAAEIGALKDELARRDARHRRVLDELVAAKNEEIAVLENKVQYLMQQVIALPIQQKFTADRLLQAHSDEVETLRRRLTDVQRQLDKSNKELRELHRRETEAWISDQLTAAKDTDRVRKEVEKRVEEERKRERDRVEAKYHSVLSEKEAQISWLIVQRERQIRNVQIESKKARLAEKEEEILRILNMLSEQQHVIEEMTDERENLKALSNQAWKVLRHRLPFSRRDHKSGSTDSTLEDVLKWQDDFEKEVLDDEEDGLIIHDKEETLDDGRGLFHIPSTLLRHSFCAVGRVKNLVLGGVGRTVNRIQSLPRRAIRSLWRRRGGVDELDGADDDDDVFEPPTKPYTLKRMDRMPN